MAQRNVLDGNNIGILENTSDFAHIERSAGLSGCWILDGFVESGLVG
jgi:hypothetical protein